MLKSGIYFLIIFFGGSAVAENKINLADFVRAKMGIQWEGLVYECAPYCRFLGELKNGKLQGPAIATEFQANKFSYVGTSNPLYPVLVKSAVQTGAISEMADGGDSQGSRSSSNNKGEDLPEIPAFARVPYDFGWSVLSTTETISQKLSTDSQIQSALGPKSMRLYQNFKLDLAKGKPLHYFNNWFRIMGSYRIGQSLGYPIEDSSVSVKESDTEWSVALWMLKTKFQFGIAYSTRSSKLAVSEDSLTHYSSSRVDQWLGLGMRWFKRYEIEYGHLLSSKVNDSQDFRAGPFTAKGNRLGAKYCSRSYDVFDYQIGFCGGLTMIRDEQGAVINPTFSSGGESILQNIRTQVGLSLRFGEDLYQ